MQNFVGADTTIQGSALPTLIGALRAAGYEFVTVSELMLRGE